MFPSFRIPKGYLRYGPQIGETIPLLNKLIKDFVDLRIPILAIVYQCQMFDGRRELFDWTIAEDLCQHLADAVRCGKISSAMSPNIIAF